MPNLIHVSDLHVGLDSQEWLWPNLKHLFFDDIRRLEDRNGPADLVIFTGDLTQKSDHDEYKKLSEIFYEIQSKLISSAVKFVTLPGNHDLVRPGNNSFTENAFRNLIRSSNIDDEVFGRDKEFTERINELFESYSKWHKGAIDDGLVVAPTVDGLIPGDASYVLELQDTKIACVTLNSTWMQVSGANYEGQLHISSKQLLAVTENDPVDWLQQFDLRLLATHHPKNWFSTVSTSTFDSHIFPAGRFDAHLFGHMHEHLGVQKSFGGGAQRREIQAASLFGLEKIEGRVERSHGYSYLSYEKERGSLSLFPRTLMRLSDGNEKLVPDHRLHLDESNSYTWNLGSNKDLSASSQPANTINPATEIDGDQYLKKIQYHLNSHAAHAAIRFSERADTIEALVESGIIWHICDWGNGEDEFLHTCLNRFKVSSRNIYRLDLDGYKGRDWLFNSIKSNIGVSFEMLCELVSQRPDSLLIFDNIASEGVSSPGARPLEEDVEDLANILRTYAPNCIIILRGKPNRQIISKSNIALRALDEADVLDYLRAHGSGGIELLHPDTITTIWRVTGGSPSRIDTLLRDLEVTSLDDLLSGDQDTSVAIHEVETPTALVGAVESLRTSEVALHKRAFSLLEALSVLPRGEQLSTLKRFYGPIPLHPSHALELSGRRLAETITLIGTMVGDRQSPAKVLVSPKAVRDHVQKITSDQRRGVLLGLAFEMYFSDEWRSGDIKSSLAAKVSRDPLADPYRIINVTTLLIDEIRLAMTSDDDLRLSQLTAASSSLTQALLDGHHYRFASQFATQLLSELAPINNDRRIDIIRYLNGRALRMIGRHDEARNMFVAIDIESLGGSQKRMMNLNLALIYQYQDNYEEAKKYANKVLKKKGDGIAIQAEQILAEQIEDDRERLTKFRSLEARARKSGASVSANNLSLSIASATKSDEERDRELEKVMESGRSDKDFYNSTRAVIRLMDNEATNTNPRPEHIARLAQAYHHLYNERSESLFDRCHKALWNLFGKSKEVENLFSLFRYSSFTWRLRGDEAKELEYLDTLAKLLPVLAPEQKRMIARELSYYRGRASRTPLADSGKTGAVPSLPAS